MPGLSNGVGKVENPGDAASDDLPITREPSEPPESPRPRRVPRRPLALATASLLALAAFAAYQALTWPDVAALAERRPESTAFIETYRARRRAAGEPDRVAWTWVPWSGISVHLKRAAVSAEDMEFFFHRGFSRHEIEAAVREALTEGGSLRGASTITQQLAKNLWLTPSRNPWRKVKELLLARSLERHLTKRRILEIYLNVVEFGRGVYGAEAAARHYFGKPASDLTEREAAMLAAGLPRPSSWHPGSGSGAYARYVDEVEGRMARAVFLWRYLGTAPPAPAVADSLLVADSLVIPDSLLVPIESLPPPPPADSDTTRRDTIPGVDST